MPLGDRRTIQPGERLPPQDLDAEMALLGAMLVDRETIGEALEILGRQGSNAFYRPDHRKLFEALVGMYDKGDPIDLLTMAAELRQRDSLEEIGGQDYMVQLAESCADWANAEYYARIVRRAWQKREIIRQSHKATEAAYDEATDPGELAAECADLFERIDQASHVDREAQPESQILRDLENPRNTADRVVPIGIGNLGRLLDGGLEKGTLTVCGARPSCGKTSLALGLCLHASLATDGCPSLFVSLEMTPEQIGQRFMSMRSGLPVRRIRSGDVGDSEFIPARNRAALEAEGGRSIFVLNGVNDGRAIAAHARRHVRKDGIALVVVDYLGLCDLSGKFDRYDLKLGEIAATFKRLALDTRVAVVLLEQLSRECEKQNRRPRISDLRDSGKIEAHADNIILIKKGGDTNDLICDTLFIVGKQRQGDTGDTLVSYDKRTMMYVAKYYGPESPTVPQQPLPAQAAAAGDHPRLSVTSQEGYEEVVI